MPFFGRRRPAEGPTQGILAADIAFTRNVFRQAVLDIRSAALWLRSRKEIDSSKTGIVGVSLGAVIGALTVSLDNSFNRSALVLGGGDVALIVWTSPETADLKEELSRKGYTLDKLRDELRPVDPLTYAHRIDPATLIMFNAKNDRTVVNECTVKFWEKARQPKIVWFNSSHFGITLYAGKIMEDIASFIQN
jgi:cephalosporin-C deacetylase-like acetyl esterase